MDHPAVSHGVVLDDINTPITFQKYTIGIAHSLEDQQSIFALRKQVYLDELRYLSNIDSPYYQDDLDIYSTNIWVKHNGVLVGTARFTDQRIGELELTKDVNWQPLVPSDRNYCEITRLLFEPRWRNLSGTTLLFAYIHSYCIRLNISGIVIGAEKKWTRYYSSLGFERIPNSAFRMGDFKNSPEYDVYLWDFHNAGSEFKFRQTIDQRLGFRQ